MPGGPEPLEDPCHADLSAPAAEPSLKLRDISVGESSACKARIIGETSLVGRRSPRGVLHLLGTMGVLGLGPVGQVLGPMRPEVPNEKSRAGNKLEGTMPLKIRRGVLSPFLGVDSWGLKQRPPAPWAVVGVLAVGLLACLFMLFSIQASLGNLREEVATLRREGVCQAPRMDDNQDSTGSQQTDVAGPLDPALRTRWTREVGKKPQDPLSRPRKQQQKQLKERQKRPGTKEEFPDGKHSVLHLVPARHSNNEEGDATEIWWSPFLKQGRALQPSGQDVVVKHTGLYFVYSQVLFRDPTFTMGQVLLRVALGRPDQTLFRCVQSMPPKVEKAYNSCYSGGVFHLQQGDRLSLHIPRFNASFDISPHGTFLGVLRL